MMSPGSVRLLLVIPLKPPALLGVLFFWLLVAIVGMWIKMTVWMTALAVAFPAGYGRYRRAKLAGDGIF